jgi:hypothetical protein
MKPQKVIRPDGRNWGDIERTCLKEMGCRGEGDLDQINIAQDRDVLRVVLIMVKVLHT